MALAVTAVLTRTPVLWLQAFPIAAESLAAVDDSFHRAFGPTPASFPSKGLVGKNDCVYNEKEFLSESNQ